MSDEAEKRWTVLGLIRWTTGYFNGKGIDTPRLDAELLLAQVLDVDRMGLYVSFDRPMAPHELAAFRELVKARARRTPVKYLTGECEFMSLAFEVGSGVLIPRPETEHLVERAVEILQQEGAALDPLVYDVGTGSGCIAVAVAAAVPGARVTASDVSAEALAIAARNVDRHELADRVTLLEGDLMGPFPPGEQADLVLSNPPYVAEGEWAGLQPEITEHEPRVALVAGSDGLECIRRLLDTAPAHTKPDAALLCEIGDGQAAAVAAMVERNAAYQSVAFHPDLAGIERVCEARLKGSEGLAAAGPQR